MSIRSLTSFSLVTVLALGLAACGDDGKPNLTTATTATTPGTTNTTNTTNNNTTDGTATDTDTDTDGTDAGTATESTATDPTATTTTAPTTTEDTVTTTTTTDDTATTTTTTVSTTQDETTDTTTGGAGGEYLGCGAMGECPAGSDCLMITGLEGNFCAPQCDGMMCPATGSAAQGQCVLSMGMGNPTHCAALCPPGDDTACPAGTTCKEVPDQPQPVGVCTAP